MIVIDHPVDNIELMDDWAFGGISEEEQNEIINHLANCHYCRREVSAMVREGVLTFSTPAMEKQVPVLRQRDSRRVIFPMAIAIVLMFTVLGYWAMLPKDKIQPSPPIAHIEFNFTFPLLSEFSRTRDETNVDDTSIEKIIQQAGTDPLKRFEAGLKLLPVS
jgi:hypothetical protein